MLRLIRTPRKSLSKIWTFNFMYTQIFYSIIALRIFESSQKNVLLELRNTKFGLNLLKNGVPIDFFVKIYQMFLNPGIKISFTIGIDIESASATTIFFSSLILDKTFLHCLFIWHLLYLGNF